MVSKIQRVTVHELSHLIVYLYVGGDVKSIRTMQLKPSSGYVDILSHTVANNYFAHACVALAGPIGDKLLNVEGYDNPKTGDMKNANQRINYWVSENDSKENFQSEFDLALRVTEDILAVHWEFIHILAAETHTLLNKQNVISRTKMQNLARLILSQWDKDSVTYYKHPKAFTAQSHMKNENEK